MELTHLFIKDEYLNALGWTLAHSIWQIVLISLLLWLLLKIPSKKMSGFRYSAALMALVLVVTACSLTFVHHLSEPERTPTHFPLVQKNLHESPQTPAISGNTLGAAGFWGFLTQKVEPYLPFLVNLWILGALFYLVRFIGSLYDLQKLHNQHHEEVSLPIKKKVESLTASMGIFRKVKVLNSYLVHTPVTFGIFKPVILLPVGLVFNMAPDQLEAIIAHELGHIKRYDFLVNLFQTVLEIMFFYHPCFWWINALINEERENATDDWCLAIGISPKALALGLAEVANHSSSGTPEMTLAASTNKSLTLHRIRRILGRSTPTPKLSPLMTLTMIFTIIVGTLLVVGAQNPDIDRKKETLLLTEVNNQAFLWEGAIATKLLQKRLIQDQKDTVPSLEKPPSLHLSPAPKMDVQLPPGPEFLPVPIIPPFEFSLPQIDLKVQTDSISVIVKEMEKLKDDNSPEGISKKEALKSAMSKVEQDMKIFSQIFTEKMEAWQEKHGESMKKFEAEMKIWEEKMEEHGKLWEDSFAPKMKEFEFKMKEWEKENAPKIKEFEEKMKIWEEENKGKTHSLKSTPPRGFINYQEYLKSINKKVEC